MEIEPNNADVNDPQVQGNTASLETENQLPEGTDLSSKEDNIGEPKTYTEDEITQIVEKRLARARRKWERDSVEQVKQAQPKSPEEINPEQFESYEAYAEALAERIAEEKVTQREKQRQQKQIVDAHLDREDEIRSKYDDYDDVVHADNVPFNETIAEAIVLSEIGPEVAYYLAKNRKELDKIISLSPIAQVKEIGKIEARLIAEPPTKRISSAPEPIKPLNGRASSTPVYDTTDPRSDKLTTSEWIARERQRLIQKYQSQR